MGKAQKKKQPIPKPPQVEVVELAPREERAERPPRIVLPFRVISRPEQIRRILAGLSILSVLSIVTYVALAALHSISLNGVYPDKVFNELTKTSIEIRLNQSESYFQLASVVLGALWGLLIAKKSEAVLVFEDIPEIIMLVCSSILLSSSAIIHFIYVNRVTDLYYSAADIMAKQAKVKLSIPMDDSIPDIFDKSINYLYLGQSFFLWFGLLISLITFYSTHKLKL